MMIHSKFIALAVVKTRRIIISEITNENHSPKLRIVVECMLYICSSQTDYI